MKLIALFSLVCFTALAQVTPINKGRLQSNLDGNQQSITNLAGVVAGSFTGNGAGVSNVPFVVTTNVCVPVLSANTNDYYIVQATNIPAIVGHYKLDLARAPNGSGCYFYTNTAANGYNMVADPTFICNNVNDFELQTVAGVTHYDVRTVFISPWPTPAYDVWPTNGAGPSTILGGYGTNYSTNCFLQLVQSGDALTFSTNVFVASRNGAALNGHYVGGHAAGSDDTAVLNAILAKATNHPSIKLVIDSGTALVTGLEWYSNTVIEMYPGSGLLLADNSYQPLLRNHSPSVGTVTNHDLYLNGGTYDLNGLNQGMSGTGLTPPAPWIGDAYCNGLCFYGATNIYVEGVNVINANTYHFLFSNWRNVYLLRSRCFSPQVGTFDGFHFFGGGTNLIVRDVRGRTETDFIACNSADYMAGEVAPWVRNNGEMADIDIDGVYFEDGCGEGVSFLVTSNHIRNVMVRNVRGKVVNHGIRFWNFWNPTFGSGGYIDNVLVDDMDVVAGGPITIDPFFVGNSVRIKNFMISNTKWTDQGGPDFIGNKLGHTDWIIDQLTVNGFTIEETNGPSNLSLLNNNGSVTNAAFANISWMRPPGAKSDYIVLNEPGGYIGTLSMTSLMLATNMAATITNAGTISLTNALKALGALTVDQFISIPTNYSPANFIPIAGRVKIASSNGALFSVTQLSTNALSGP